MIIQPPLLQKGDTIAIVCPAGFLPIEKALQAKKILEQWGFHVLLGKTVGNQYHYFSGTDAERLADVQNMLDNTTVKAILFGRGGYGVSRIIDNIDWTRFQQQPKWLVGFSDITLIHAHVYQQYQTASIHSLMAAAFQQPDSAYVQSILQALTGKTTVIQHAAHPLNICGTATGTLIGGNLTLIAHAIGTASAYQTNNCMVYLEDVGEYLYHIDRMLIQLKRSGFFNNIAALILGGFSDLKDTVIPFGKSIEEILHTHFADAPFPVCYQFPVGHTPENYALRNGSIYSLAVTNNGVTLTEC